MKIISHTTKFFVAFLLAFAFHAASANEVVSEKISGSTAIDNMLAVASIEENVGNNKSNWQAAKLYCEASRLGSIEAQYKLGVLYAFGKGVPKNREYAATLFAIASQQGYHEATEMLEAIHYTSDVAPPCITQAVDPEKISYKSGGNLPTGQIDQYLARLPKQQKWVIDLVNTTSEWYQVDPKLILSIIAIESGFNRMATSNANAMGLMQLIPATADRFNVKNAYDAVQNIKGGVRYLSWLLNYYSGDVTLVVAAYNAGEKAVDRYRGVPPYKETVEYVKKFKKLYTPEQHPYREKQ